MTTYTKLGDGGTVGHPSIKRVPYLVENTFDATGQNVAAADTVQMLAVTAETLVINAGIEILTASSGSVTYQLGDGSDANRYMTATAADATGHKATVAAVTNVGHIYASADTLDLLGAGATDTAGKIRMWAVMVDVSGVDETDRN
jgi:hypothetical protein